MRVLECPSDADLELLLNEQLDEPALSGVVTHVEQCRRCQDVLDQRTAGLSGFLRASRPGTALETPQVRAVDTVDVPVAGLAMAAPAEDGFGVHETVDAVVEPVMSRPEAAWPEVPGHEIFQELGHGGMGVVYKARQQKLNRLVALKMIRAGSSARPDQLERFRIEAEAVARLQHPNIVQIFEVGEANGLPYFSLELLEGGTLDQRLAASTLPARAAAELVATLAGAVHAAHKEGIIHRDLKPANVLFNRTGFPKVTDFGLAKRVEDGPGQTQSGQVVGTPCYMAPEQARADRQAIGPPADVYALGAILYETLVGRPPFKGATPIDTVLLVLSEEPVPPRNLQPKVPRDLETICLKCIHKEPEGRYSSAEALADDLRRFLNGEPIEARPVSPLQRGFKWVRRHRTAAALIAVVVLFLVALPVVGLAFSHQIEKRTALEEKRLADARTEVFILRDRSQTAAKSQDWKQAETLLDRAIEKILAEPALAGLRDEVEAVRTPVKSRLAALDTRQRFLGERDEAIFHATLASGENFAANYTAALDHALAALGAVGLRTDGVDVLHLGPSFTAEETAEITAGSYTLFLTLAEMEARGLSQPRADEQPTGLKKALALLDRADRLGPRTRAIHLRRGRYLVRLNDPAGAAEESKRAQELAAETDRDPEDHFLVGYELYSQRELEAATHEFRRALQLDSRHFWAHYFQGICSMATDKPDVATAHFTICQSQRPGFIWIYLLRGFALGQLEDYAAAEADFEQALALKPSADTLFVLYNNRGVMRVGEEATWKKGVEDLQRAVNLRPSQCQVRASLAEAYRLADRLDEARKHLDEAVTLGERQFADGKLPGAALGLLHHSRARLFLQRSERDAAIADLELAAKWAGNDRSLQARAHADRGRVLHLQGRFDKALTAYDEALASDKNRTKDVYLWRGEVLLVLLRDADAIEAFNGYLSRGGAAAAPVLRQRGLAQSRLGRHSKAIEDYTLALGAQPNDEETVSLHLYRGQEYLAENAPRPALADFEDALRIRPTNADASLCCAFARIKLGKLPQALADADRAVQDSPREPHVWQGAARVYAQAAATEARSQDRAAALLRASHDLVAPTERRKFWNENVAKDAVLYSLRRHPAVVDLFDLYGNR